VDLVVTLSKPASAEDINSAYRSAATDRMKGILAVSEEPLVSSDYIGNSYSCTIDSELTNRIGESKAKVIGW
jgi:glyceraldehyde 3-phosphate dehydrogenase